MAKLFTTTLMRHRTSLLMMALFLSLGHFNPWIAYMLQPVWQQGCHCSDSGGKWIRGSAQRSLIKSSLRHVQQISPVLSHLYEPPSVWRWYLVTTPIPPLPTGGAPSPKHRTHNQKINDGCTMKEDQEQAGVRHLLCHSLHKEYDSSMHKWTWSRPLGQPQTRRQAR